MIIVGEKIWGRKWKKICRSRTQGQVVWASDQGVKQGMPSTMQRARVRTPGKGNSVRVDADRRKVRGCLRNWNGTKTARMVQVGGRRECLESEIQTKPKCGKNSNSVRKSARETEWKVHLDWLIPWTEPWMKESKGPSGMTVIMCSDLDQMSITIVKDKDVLCDHCGVKTCFTSQTGWDK